LLTAWTTVLWASIGAIIKITPVTLAILLALFCAARMILNGTMCFGACLTAVQSWLGDIECAALDAATTGFGAFTVLSPAANTIDGACCSVALLLLLLSITMGAVETALVAINEVVLPRLPASTTFTRAITPGTPCTTDMLVHHWCWSIIVHRSISGTVTSTPCFFSIFAARQLALLIRSILDACLLEGFLALLCLAQLGERSALLGVCNPDTTASLPAGLLAFLLVLLSLLAFAPLGLVARPSGCLLALLLGLIGVEL